MRASNARSHPLQQLLEHKELVGEDRERGSGGIDVDGAVDVDRFDDAC